MGRAKVKLEPITDERSRKSTFLRRKKGLKKKIYEFSTLCDVDACMIIFGPKQGDRLVEPETWPENREDVLNIIERCRKQSTEEGGGGRRKRHIDLPQFCEDQTKKLRCELAKLQQRNDMAKYPSWDDRIRNFSVEELKTLIASLNSKLELVKLKIDLFDDDVTGLIEYPVPPLNQNPLPTLYGDSVHHHDQSLWCLNPLDYPHCLSTDYVPLDPSVVFKTTTVISGMDCTGNCNGAYSSKIPYRNPAVVVPPMSNQIYHNEMCVVNNAGGGGPLPWYFCPNMQPTMESYFAPQLHQINEFSDLQDFQANGMAGSSTFHALDDHQP